MIYCVSCETGEVCQRAAPVLDWGRRGGGGHRVAFNQGNVGFHCAPTVPLPPLTRCRSPFQEQVMNPFHFSENMLRIGHNKRTKSQVSGTENMDRACLLGVWAPIIMTIRAIPWSNRTQCAPLANLGEVTISGPIRQVQQ